MKLVTNTYGKGRVRVMRIQRDGPRHVVRELSVTVMLVGDFDRHYTHADNTNALCTDTVKNIVNIVARENLKADTEHFSIAVAEKFLEKYPQVSTATVTARETKWLRMNVDGKPHAHSFVLDSNGNPVAKVIATRAEKTIESGVSGFTFMKSTESGWEHYFKDEYTTLAETHDRMCATSMDAVWRWKGVPTDYGAANSKILETMLGVFATTYSESVQASLYRMATAALNAESKIGDLRLACPNKHYLLINLKPFGLTNENQVFVPTDEPHGQIECCVARE